MIHLIVNFLHFMTYLFICLSNPTPQELHDFDNNLALGTPDLQ